VKRGADTDIESGLPKEQVAAKLKTAEEAGKTASLQEKAKFLNIMQSDAGIEIEKIVETKLRKRIEKLIKSDPEATAYHNILKELGYKINQAKNAIDDLYMNNLSK